MKTFIAVFLCTLTFSTYAEVPLKREVIEHLVEELSALHETGVKIHDSYNLENIEQLRACFTKYGNLRGKAKSLRKNAEKLPRISYRVPLVLAADDAFTCIYCGGDGGDCERIPTALEAVQNQLSDETTP